ncbi:MAG: ATP-binding protein [Betaproteobacteria bacterium]|nr:MAG: ATP-binding protein [Betaproteobacteria bacterium]
MIPPGTALAGLAPGELRRRCDALQLGFATTAELDPLDGTPGQARAAQALEFGVGMRREGYNLFAMGPEGYGRHSMVRQHLEEHARGMVPAADWCYVFNFKSPHRPRALRLPAGGAPAFKAAMGRLVEDLSAAITAAFETDEYRNRHREIETELSERQERAIDEIGERAKAQGIALVRTPSGFGFAPMNAGRTGVMDPEEFGRLAAEEQKRYEEQVGALQKELGDLFHQMPKWRREALDKMRGLDREVTRAAINSLIDELKAAYGALPAVQEYLAQVKEDTLENAGAFRQAKEGETPTLFGIPLARPEGAEAPLRRYAVNVLIQHLAADGAPVVYEDHPSHAAIVGRIEHVSQMGALVTDFTLIRSGALHRANGGYLVLDALKVLTLPYAWEALKRALRAREIDVRTLGQELGIISTVSLEPEPIPLDVKVVLVGERYLYYLLHTWDPDFAELFKVAVDFEEDMPRGPQDDALYARLIAGCVRREKLRALDRAAVARVIEYQARDSGDAHKLSVRMQALVDLLHEADYWAGTAGHAVIGGEDVGRAIDAQIARCDRVRQRLQESIVRGSQLIDTSGSRVAQVNGLAVLQLGDFAFGTPHRITARVRLGGGGVVDIERESELGGPIHSKGVLILSGYLSGRYVLTKPLSLSGSLVFEQSYGGVEGDSASSAELYALLSALADAPVRQSLAVTGSVNQHGDIQAIGGVNEKIEGFFDLCKARGLGDGQGVLIPEANVKNLMLREEVVDAVAQGRFAVYAVRTVDEGIELLTGVPAKEIHARVETRLAEFAERARAFAVTAGKKPWRPERRK